MYSCCPYQSSHLFRALSANAFSGTLPGSLRSLRLDYLYEELVPLFTQIRKIEYTKLMGGCFTFSLPSYIAPGSWYVFLDYLFIESALYILLTFTVIVMHLRGVQLRNVIPTRIHVYVFLKLWTLPYMVSWA